jgi:hypothetical protein
VGSCLVWLWDLGAWAPSLVCGGFARRSFFTTQEVRAGDHLIISALSLLFRFSVRSKLHHVTTPHSRLSTQHTRHTRSALSHPTLFTCKHSQARGESAKLPNSVGHTRHARRHILAHLSTQTTYSQSLSTLRFSCVIAFMAINLPVEIAFMAINLPVEIQHSHRRLTAASRAVVNRTAHFKSLSLRLPV